jgi:hypothetical protein
MKSFLINMILKALKRYAKPDDLKALLKGLSNKKFGDTQIDDLSIDAAFKLIFDRTLPVDELLKLYDEVKNVTNRSDRDGV